MSQVSFIYPAENPRKVILRTLEQGGLVRAKIGSQDWSLLWTYKLTREQFHNLRPGQKANHFPGSQQLGRKDLLWRNVLQMQTRLGAGCHILPTCFVLPGDAEEWQRVRSEQPDVTWICKPSNGRCGKDISILGPSTSPLEDVDRKYEEVSQRPGIAQVYISNPHLINDYKYDLRLYVVVTSFEPLRIYLNGEGLVRFATEKYSQEASTLSNTMMHLTNYSINKSSPAFVKNQDGSATSDDDAQASKWSFQELRAHFDGWGLDFEGVFGDIKRLLVKMMMAVEPVMKRSMSSDSIALDHSYDANAPSQCFEIYGVDVLLDDCLKPWLLEVNIHPSLSATSPLDRRIKTQLVADTLTLAGIPLPGSHAQDTSSGSAVRKRLTSKSKDARSQSASQRSMAERGARLKAMGPKVAVGNFDEQEWDIVMEAWNERARAGGLECIFPSAALTQQSRFFEDESYANIVLRKWHEAGAPVHWQ